MNHIIHISVQFVPLGRKEESFKQIDQAIEVFQSLGVLRLVTPMESVLEGTYVQLMQALELAIAKAIPHYGQELVINLRMHMAKGKDLSWEEKLTNYAK